MKRSLPTPRTQREAHPSSSGDPGLPILDLFDPPLARLQRRVEAKMHPKGCSRVQRVLDFFRRLR